MHLLFRLNPTTVVGSLQLGDTKFIRKCSYHRLLTVPGPSLFVPSICIHSNTQSRGAVEKNKTGKFAFLVFIHHVSEYEVDIKGLIIKRVCTKLESDFLLVETSIFDHANAWSLELQQDTNG